MASRGKDAEYWRNIFEDEDNIFEIENEQVKNDEELKSLAETAAEYMIDGNKFQRLYARKMLLKHAPAGEPYIERMLEAYHDPAARPRPRFVMFFP
jgi:hypothetical protein